MAPSTRFNVVAIYEFMKLLGFKRVGVLYGDRSINNMIKDMFLEMVEADLQTGGYSWTILLMRQVSNRADAGSALDFMKMRDSRVNFIALRPGWIYHAAFIREIFSACMPICTW